MFRGLQKSFMQVQPILVGMLLSCFALCFAEGFLFILFNGKTWFVSSGHFPVLRLPHYLKFERRSLVAYYHYGHFSLVCSWWWWTHGFVDLLETEHRLVRSPSSFSPVLYIPRKIVQERCWRGWEDIGGLSCWFCNAWLARALVFGGVAWYVLRQLACCFKDLKEIKPRGK